MKSDDHRICYGDGQFTFTANKWTLKAMLDREWIQKAGYESKITRSGVWTRWCITNAGRAALLAAPPRGRGTVTKAQRELMKALKDAPDRVPVYVDPKAYLSTLEELERTQRQGRALKKALETLTYWCGCVLRCLDVVGPREGNGKDLAVLANYLEFQNDHARHFALGIDLSKDPLKQDWTAANVDRAIAEWRENWQRMRGTP